MNNKYETIFVLSTKSLDEPALEAATEKFKALIAEHGAVESVDVWGKRRLAYPINDETEGYYVLYNFAGGPEFPAELNRVSKITSGVLRSLIVRKEEKSAKAKAAEKKAEEKAEEKAEQ